MKQGLTRHRERSARIQIDGEALRHNLGRVKACAPSSKVMAVIKANAYGHDVLAAASYLDAADAFALAMPAEAVALRRAGCSRPLIVLQGFANQEELKLCSSYDLQPVIHQQWQAELLYSASRFSLDVGSRSTPACTVWVCRWKQSIRHTRRSSPPRWFTASASCHTSPMLTTRHIH